MTSYTIRTSTSPDPTFLLSQCDSVSRQTLPWAPPAPLSPQTILKHLSNTQL